MTDEGQVRAEGFSAGKVAWKRVAVFYAIALGMVSVLGLVYWLLGVDMGGAPALVYQLTVAFLYMPMPLVAGLVVERMAGRPALIRKTWSQFKSGWWRIILISAVSAIAIYLLNLGLTLVLGNVLGVPGVGHLVSTQSEWIASLKAIAPAGVMTPDKLASMPPVALMYFLGAVSGIAAGFTVNGLFAFGEEYGWRGVLMDELRPLGAVRANLLTGVMWGLWHAPIILLGFNYGAYRLPGVFMMCVWVTPLSFLLWRSREYSGSVIAPAVIHGAFNGSAGFFVLLIASRHPLVGAPVGVLGGVSIAIVAAVVWAATEASIRRRDPLAENPAPALVPEDGTRG